LLKWQAAKRAVLAGQRDARVLCIGDSTTAGQGATNNGSASDCRSSSWPTQLVALLNAAGLPASPDSMMASGSLTMPAGDARITSAVNWVASTASAGGLMLLNSTTTDPLSFAPAGVFDSFDIWYVQNSGFATFTVNVDGGATLATVNANGSANLVKTTVQCARGTHTINIARNGTGTNLFIAAIICYDSQDKRALVLNAGYSGSAISQWNDMTTGWGSLNASIKYAPDLSIICVDINDAANGVAAESWLVTMRNIIKFLKASGDIIIAKGCGSNPAIIAQATQDTYAVALARIRQEYNLPSIVNFTTEMLGGWTAANAAGLMYDDKHPLASGYARHAAAVFRALGV
jgi:lysophospholipase L1-like esterase